MKNQTHASDADLPCPVAGGQAKLNRALRLLSGKWKAEILWHLVPGRQCFGELRRSIPGVTQHMLTAQLRDLETEGLVKRTTYAEVPPRVEYEMTPAAQALRPVFEELFRWADGHFHETGGTPGSSETLPTARPPA